MYLLIYRRYLKTRIQSELRPSKNAITSNYLSKSDVNIKIENLKRSIKLYNEILRYIVIDTEYIEIVKVGQIEFEKENK